MEILKGGFEIRPEDRDVINAQRAITKQINDYFIQVGAVFLKMSGKNPISEDWAKSNHKDINLQDWIDNEDLNLHNVGFNLQQGWLDIDIDVPDPEYNNCLIAALDHLGLDTRFRFGRRSVGYPTHVMVQLGEEESVNFENLRKFEPKEFILSKGRYHTQLRSYPTNINDTTKNLMRVAKQTVMPGSVYSSKTISGDYDLSVWYDKNGEIAENVRQIAGTTPHRAGFSLIIRAIAFGTFLYLVKDHWISGQRQLTANKLSGWLARVVRDSAAMNNHEAVGHEVFCPVDDDAIVESLLTLVCAYTGDEEPFMRIRTYYDAVEKLSRNPDARIPGWPTIETMLGGEAVHALRTVFTPGSDISVLTMLAERYVYDESDNMYIDRKRFPIGDGFVFDNTGLYLRHKPEIVRVGGKPREAFKIFESSDMRKKVDKRDMFPDLDAGGIFRFKISGEAAADDEETAVVTFNTWRGWPVLPTENVDAELLKKCEEYTDRLFAYLTRDNAHQIEWLKDWVAWTFQYPAKKQQIAPVIIGGQGVGKSFFGNNYMKAMMGRLWSAASPKVMEGAFSVEPFINAMFTFIDEAKFSGDGSVDEIKKLIRNVDVGGAEKFQSSRNYRIYSRICFASNRFDMNVGQSGVVDRALFYLKAYDKDHLNMSELNFRAWTETLKPWFQEFSAFLDRRDVREHLVYMYMNRPVDQSTVESIRHSSSNDPSVVNANLTWSRRVAKYIIEDARIHDDLAIEMPFTNSDFNARVMTVVRDMGLKNVQAQRVMNEFVEAGLIEKVADGGKILMRVTHRYGDLLRIFGEATGLAMEPFFEVREEDYGENTTTLKDRIEWRGTKSVKF